MDIHRLLLTEVTLPANHPRPGRACRVFGFLVRHPAGPVLVDTGVGVGHPWVDARLGVAPGTIGAAAAGLLVTAAAAAVDRVEANEVRAAPRGDEERPASTVLVSTSAALIPAPYHIQVTLSSWDWRRPPIAHRAGAMARSVELRRHTEASGSGWSRSADTVPGMGASVEVRALGGDRYQVEVDDGSGASRHEVTVAPADAVRLGAGAAAEHLIEASFRFLLEREPKEAILTRFDLAVIGRYFPEYADEIRRRLAGP